MNTKDQPPEPGSGQAAERESLPVVEEKLKVGKREVAGGKVVVRKAAREHHEVVDLPLEKEVRITRRRGVRHQPVGVTLLREETQVEQIK